MNFSEEKMNSVCIYIQSCRNKFTLVQVCFDILPTFLHLRMGKAVKSHKYAKMLQYNNKIFLLLIFIDEW